MPQEATCIIWQKNSTTNIVWVFTSPTTVAHAPVCYDCIQIHHTEEEYWTIAPDHTFCPACLKFKQE